MRRKTLLLLAAAFSLCLLGVAWIAQYHFSLHPCELCMAQRYPYLAIVGISLVGAWFCNAKLLNMALILVATLFFLDAAIAFYHAGVELHLFPGPSACTNTSTSGQTLEELREAIRNAPLVACDQAMVQVWGLSMAAWNGIAALLGGILVGTASIMRGSKHAKP